MRLLILLIAFSPSLWAQQKISENELSKLLIVHNYHCNFKNKKFDKTLPLGELKMNIRNLQVLRKGNQLEFTGKIVDSDGNPIPSNLSLAKIGEIECMEQKFFGTAKLDGSFKVKVSCESFQSIYFTYPGFKDLELNPKDLCCR